MSDSSIFADVLQRAIKLGLVGAAVVDRDGNVIDRAGASADDERSSLADLLAHLRSEGSLTSRLFAGEAVVLALGYDELAIAVAVARQELFVMAVITDSTTATIDSVCALRDRVAGIAGRTGNPGAGPAELQIVELGVTVPRKRGDA